MFLRTVALLLLCASLALSATLVYHQTEAKEEQEAPVVESLRGDGEAHGATTNAAADGEVGDSNGNKVLGQTKVETTDSSTALTEEHHSSEDSNANRPVQTIKPPNKPPAEEEANSWSLTSIRNSFQTVHGYFDTLVELVGGHNGVCQYRCRYGELPRPRPNFQQQETNGCNSSLMGFQFDVGIPAMTKCCNQLDSCYDTCGVNKYDCDAKFRVCLHALCSDLKKSLGFVSKVQACESMADALYNTVWTLGCRPYMNSQRAACVCEGEERDEL
ncbi:Group XIIB secretory phospholipase A2-like protein [Oryzias melastigma]|uniref:Group XIIB secretory phospholipase A2-like protein n=1 Tax=Oryzias melastigma TaxID=30732 RepID=A0A834C128_ORYME|nr:Group XIIB secretory phospholipase A2-like protein [Oryzias melastigma]